MDTIYVVFSCDFGNVMSAIKAFADKRVAEQFAEQTKLSHPDVYNKSPYSQWIEVEALELVK